MQILILILIQAAYTMTCTSTEKNLITLIKP